jgi:hypothetical protein
MVIGLLYLGMVNVLTDRIKKTNSMISNVRVYEYE